MRYIAHQNFFSSEMQLPKIFKTVLKPKLATIAILLFLHFVSLIRAGNLPLKIYTSGDGLGSSAIIDIFRDSRSLLWFATRDGLSRFDGVSFTNYRLSDDRESSAQTVFKVIEAANGNFLVTTNHGLYRFKRTSTGETQIDLSSASASDTNNRLTLVGEKISDKTFGVLFIDSSGRAWGGTGDGLYLFEEKDGAIVLQRFPLDDSSESSDNMVRAIYEAPDKSFWVGCNTGVYHRRTDGRTIFYPLRRISSYDQIFDIKPHENGRLWIAHTRGIFLLNPSGEDFDSAGFATRELHEQTANVTAREFVVPETAPGSLIWLNFARATVGENNPHNSRNDAIVNSIFKTATSELWFAANGFLFREQNNRIERLTDTPVLPSLVESIADDADGNLWFGTSSGAFKLTRQGLTTFGTSEGLADAQIHSIYQTAAGELLVVSGDWVVNRFADNRFTGQHLQLPAGLTYLWTSQAALIDEKDWWILTSDGLYLFNGENPQAPAVVYRQSDNLKSSSIYRAFKDRAGHLWFSMRGINLNEDGLARFDPATKKFYLFSESDGFPPRKSVASFAETANGDLWLGLYEGGLMRLRGNQLTDFSAREDVPRGGIMDMHTDGQDRLWLASTENGAAVIENAESEDPGSVRFAVIKNLASNNARCLTEDLAGNIYVGTVRGVDRIEPETKRIRHFSVADGLAADFVRTAFRDRDGNLWFGTPNGLSKLVPTAETKPLAPQIFINELSIAGTRYRVSEFGQTEISNIAVDADKNNLEIDFFSVGDAASVSYQYKLEGAANDEWSAPSARRTISFANLSPGEYQFSVRAVNNLALQSENPAIVSFIIRPPFYRTWAFYAAVLLLAGTGIFALERFRAAKRKEIETALDETKTSETRFRSLVEQSPLGIMILGADGTIRSANQAYLRIWGGGVTFEQIRDWDPAADEQLVAHGVPEGLGRAFAGEPYIFQPIHYELRRNGADVEIPDGSPEFIWMQVVAYPVKSEDGQLREVICFFEDITEKQNARDNLEQSRMERLAELEQVRRRIATDLHDDIGSSLTQIAVLSEVAKRQFPMPKKAENSPLERITAVSNELVETMSDIVWAINPNKDNLRDLVQRVRRFIHDIFTAREIEFQFSAPDLEENILIGANLRREIFVICKEAVTNIVRHSNCRAANVEIRLENDVLFLEIADDGCGFESENILDEEALKSKGGNGLKNICRRTEDLNGVCEIISFINQGTKIKIRIPLHQVATYVSGMNGGENRVN